MAISKVKIESEIEDSKLLAMALFFGWTETIIVDEAEIPNPKTYQEFVFLNILGNEFIATTYNRICEPVRNDTLPKDYPALIELTKIEVLSSTTVTVNGKIIYP